MISGRLFSPQRLLRNSMLPIALLLGIAFTGCSSDSTSPTQSAAPTGFPLLVNAAIVPLAAKVADKRGTPSVVAACKDSAGVQSDFVEGIVLLRPKNDADLQAFLQHYGGKVVGDDSIPEPPAELDIPLTPEQRKPTQYAVRINLETLDLTKTQTQAQTLGIAGVTEVSSEAGSRTLAGVLDARAGGFAVSGDFIDHSDQALPVGAIGATFNTREGSMRDAFAEPRFGSSGSQSNVTAAWQFVAAHSIQRRVRVAIIDGGYWLDPSGRPRGTNSDFPPKPMQYDVIDDDLIADGANVMSCGGPCYWHGTGSASVATGEVDNQLGFAGTGGLVADPFLIRFDGSKDQRNKAIRTAVSWQSDVVSMSFGGDCNVYCRMDDRDENPFNEAVGRGSKVAFFAAAGNGFGTPALGYDVGAGNFVHPCIEDNVICVGALADNASSPISYSNFGGQVAIFAPTNIPAMPFPSSVDASGKGLAPSQAFGPEQPQPSFTGTSASTPFVAGVAALMKALNPGLSHADLRRILIETAHPAVAPATRSIDALAAVRKAAEGIAIRNDRFEPNSLESQQTILPAAASYSQPNLNIDERDRDYFQFQSPGTSLMTVKIDYPIALGTVAPFSLTAGGGCNTPRLASNNPTMGMGGVTGRTFTYSVPGGPLQLGLNADAANAYNLGITFAANSVAPDPYEPNETAATARYLTSRVSSAPGMVSAVLIKPDVSIEATVDLPSDVDYYIVRGVTPSLGEQVLFAALPIIKLQGNTAALHAEVYQLNADSTQGALIGKGDSASCSPDALVFRVEENLYYLVRVSGATGAYQLKNTIKADPRNIPAVVKDRTYELLHPGDPIEQELANTKIFVFTADKAYSALRSADARVHLKVLDGQGAILAEGVANQGGERVALGGLLATVPYALEVSRVDAEPEPPTLALSWEERMMVNPTANLLLNPGAEITGGDAIDDFADWDIPTGLGAPRLFYYDPQEGNPSPTDPGPPDRGPHLFSGGANSPSGLQQTVAVDPALRSAIDNGSVKALFSGYFGGYLSEGDFTAAKLTFLDAGGQKLGELALATVTAREREGKTGLLPVAGSERVPPLTTSLVVDLVFTRVDGTTNDAYADALSLTLADYGP